MWRASRCGKKKASAGPAKKTVTISNIVGWLAHFNGVPHRLARMSHFPHRPAWLSDFLHRLARHTLLPCLISEKPQKTFEFHGFPATCSNQPAGILILL
jgi:hypothetical protein